MAIKKLLLGKSRGSLIPLSFSFFIFAMLLSFISINVASAYAVKRELTNLGEAAVNKSAQSINLAAYYAEINRFSSSKHVPLDCLAANQKFSLLISQATVAGKKVLIDSFDCGLYEITAQISIHGKLPVQIPFIQMGELNEVIISTKVGASSVYIPN